MQIMHNLMPELVAVPSPWSRPLDPSTVPHVSHAPDRGPRAWELVPVAVDLVAVDLVPELPELVAVDLVPVAVFVFVSTVRPCL